MTLLCPVTSSMTGLGYHYGKTMIQIAGEPGGNHAYLLNSSVPQRPPEAAAVRR